MNSFRLLAFVAAVGGLATGLSSCLAEPTFSDTPDISFKSIRRVRYTPADPSAQPVDTIFITVNYQDGDGDLGLTSDEVANDPFKSGSFVDGNGITRYFLDNYFVTPLVRNADRQLKPIDLTGGGNLYTDDGTFFHLSSTADSKAIPLRGTITRKLFAGLGDALPINQPIYFQVQIADRALHLSNIITTDSLVIPPR